MYLSFDEAFPGLLDRIGGIPTYDVQLEISKSTDSDFYELMRIFARSTAHDLPSVKAKEYDYGKVLFAHISVDAERLQSMLYLISRGENISLVEFPELGQANTQHIREQCRQIGYNHINSQQMYSYRTFPFSYHLYQIPSRIHDDNASQASLGRTGLPYFRTKTQAQMYYLRGYNSPDSTQRVDSCVEVVIEDTRGRFVNVVVHDSRIEFELGGNALSTCEIKLNGTSPDLVESISALRAQQSGVEFDVLPRDLNVILMQDTEIVDERFVSPKSSPFNCLTHGAAFLRRYGETNSLTQTDVPEEEEQPVNVADHDLEDFHPLVQEVASNLYVHGLYRQAVLDTYIALVDKVKELSERVDLEGTTLMQTVFSQKKPIIKLSEAPDQQLGFMWLFSGAVMALRNPLAHKLDNALDRHQAKEWLGFASVLLRLLDGTV